MSFPSLDAAKGEEDAGGRIRKVIGGDDKASAYAWKVLSESLLYSARRIPEIADDVVNIDNAIRWGFNWTLGPFETWDAIGLADSVARMRSEGKEIPENVEKMLASGNTSFYRRPGGTLGYYDFASGAYVPVPVSPEVIFLPALKERNKVVKENQGATLYDVGDGILCLEFHTKMNAVDGDIVSMMNEGVALAVITSYSIHYTKLYDTPPRVGAPPPAAASRPAVPSSVDNTCLEGVALMKEGKFERAMELFADVWKEIPGHRGVEENFPVALVGVKKSGDESQRQGRAGEAGKRWMAALKFFSHPALKGKKLPFSKEDLKESVDKLTDNLMEKGLADYREGRLEEARNNFV